MILDRLNILLCEIGFTRIGQETKTCSFAVFGMFVSAPHVFGLCTRNFFGIIKSSMRTWKCPPKMMTFGKKPTCLDLLPSLKSRVDRSSDEGIYT